MSDNRSPLNHDLWKELESTPEVQDWLTSAQAKPTTRHNYLTYLTDFVESSGLKPTAMLDLKKKAMMKGEPRSEVEKQIVQWLGSLRTKGLSPNTLNSAQTAVRSFFQWHGYELSRRLMRTDTTLTKYLRVPEQAEVEAMISYAHGQMAKTMMTVMSETCCRPRVFVNICWNWLEEGWETKDVAYIHLPKEYRPSTAGARKFEPAPFIGKRSIEALKLWRKYLEKSKKPCGPEDRIFPYTLDWPQIIFRRTFKRAVEAGIIKPSRPDEQTFTPKSFRKYVFNCIDACRGISEEYRRLLKGRDLSTEKYYTRENIENLRRIYRDDILPKLHPQEAATVEAKRQEAEIQKLQDRLAKLEAIYSEKLKIKERT